MSASDAAPLPRLGEVFFDVRGSSRSMRLSWYSDTGVAVFSIWQGGMCTGTFRLPIGDLPRMVEILQRGPEADGQPAHGADDGGWGEPEGYARQRERAPGGSRGPERTRLPDSDRRSYRGEDLADTAAVSVGRDDLAERHARRGGLADPRSFEYGHGRRRAGYDQDDHLAQPRYGDADYQDQLDEPPRHGYGRDAAFPADLAPDHGESSTGWDAFADGPYAGYDAERPPADAQPGWLGAAEAPAGYDQERFVPPYVRAAGGQKPPDIPSRRGDLPTAERRVAYRRGPRGGRSETAGRPEQSWATGGYSDRQEHRSPGAPAELPDRWAEH